MSSVPTDPGNAACVLYDRLVAADLGATAVGNAAADRAAITAIADAIIDTEVFDDSRHDVTTPAGTLKALLGLDLVFREAVPDMADTRDPIAKLSVRLVRTGRFDTAGTHGGALLARRVGVTRPGPPDHLDEALKAVVRVPDRIWQHVRHVLVRAQFDLRPASRLTDGELSVGCVPFLSDLTEFALEEVDGAQGLGYRLGPDINNVPPDRVSAVLEALDSSRVAIGFLPEATLDGELLERWSTTTKITAHYTDLRWILVGSGPVTTADPPVNRAVLINRLAGEEIAYQDKRSRFTLTNETIDAYQLRDRLPNHGEHFEDIDAKREITVIESTAGRFMIAICEDIDRLWPDADIFKALSPTHIFVPIFAREINENDWVEKDGEVAASRFGATVIVSNSDAVAVAREATGAKVRTPWYTAVRVQPGDDGDERVVRGRSTAHDHVVVLDIHPH